MGCRCRMTWVLWLLLLDSPSSSFTITRSPEDTVTSAPAITTPHWAACTEDQPRMSASRSHTCTQWYYLMHTQVNDSLPQRYHLACNCLRDESILALKWHNPPIRGPCFLYYFREYTLLDRWWDKSLHLLLIFGVLGFNSKDGAVTD